MQNVNVLIIGTIISDSLNDLFKTKNINPGPANIVQKYFIHAIASFDFASIDVISAPRIPSYPKAAIKRVNSQEWSILSANIHTVGFNNMAAFGFLDRQKQIEKESMEWANAHRNQDKIVIIYSMHSPFLKAAYNIKNKYPNTIIALIVPDLPQYMASYSGVKKILKRLDMNRINRLVPIVDKYILYTKYMADYFNLPNEKWIVLEGLMGVDKIQKKCIQNNNEKKICIYAGRLDRRYAIDKLIKAFKDIPNAVLHLYGNISDVNQFKPLINSIENVYYMGLLTQDEIFEVMKSADLLLNPRPSDIELAKYSCPSKTFEYMATGTPVLMTKLPGLPEEYYPYLYFFEDETVEGFQNSIKRVLGKSQEELINKGESAQKFLLENKNAYLQVKRVVDFIMD